MKLPVEVERKLGMIKACGTSVFVDLVFSGASDVEYKTKIGKEVERFDNDDDFYEYIDKKLKEALGK